MLWERIVRSRTRKRNSWSAARSCSASSATSCCRSSITQWKDHLYSLDHLKEGIGLRGYGQRDPLVEYKKESFEMFQAMKDRVDEEIVRYLWRLRPVIADEGGAVRPAASRRRRAASPLILNDPSAEHPSAVRRAARRPAASDTRPRPRSAARGRSLRASAATMRR